MARVFKEITYTGLGVVGYGASRETEPTSLHLRWGVHDVDESLNTRAMPQEIPTLGACLKVVVVFQPKPWISCPTFVWRTLPTDEP